MRCPKCGSDTKVTDSRERMKGIYRRRICPKCGHKFSSYEFVSDRGANRRLQTLYDSLKKIDIEVLKDFAL